MSGIEKPADIGSRAANIEEIRRSGCLTEPAWLKPPQSDWSQQYNLISASDEENIPSSVFMTQSGKQKAVIRWEGFSDFNRLVNKMAYIQRALSKYKPAKFVVGVKYRQSGKTIKFRLLRQEQFGEDMKSLKAGRQISKSSKVLHYSPFFDEVGLFRGKCVKGKVDWTSKQSIQFC